MSDSFDAVSAMYKEKRNELFPEFANSSGLADRLSTIASFRSTPEDIKGYQNLDVSSLDREYTPEFSGKSTTSYDDYLENIRHNQDESRAYITANMKSSIVRYLATKPDGVYSPQLLEFLKKRNIPISSVSDTSFATDLALENAYNEVIGESSLPLNILNDKMVTNWTPEEFRMASKFVDKSDEMYKLKDTSWFVRDGKVFEARDKLLAKLENGEINKVEYFVKNMALDKSLDDGKKGFLGFLSDVGQTIVGFPYALISGYDVGNDRYFDKLDKLGVTSVINELSPAELALLGGGSYVTNGAPNIANTGTASYNKYAAEFNTMVAPTVASVALANDADFNTVMQNVEGERLTYALTNYLADSITNLFPVLKGLSPAVDITKDVGKEATKQVISDATKEILKDISVATAGGTALSQVGEGILSAATTDVTNAYGGNNSYIGSFISGLANNFGTNLAQNLLVSSVMSSPAALGNIMRSRQFQTEIAYKKKSLDNFTKTQDIPESTKQAGSVGAELLNEMDASKSLKDIGLSDDYSIKSVDAKNLITKLSDEGLVERLPKAGYEFLQNAITNENLITEIGRGDFNVYFSDPEIANIARDYISVDYKGKALTLNELDELNTELETNVKNNLMFSIENALGDDLKKVSTEEFNKIVSGVYELVENDNEIVNNPSKLRESIFSIKNELERLQKISEPTDLQKITGNVYENLVQNSKVDIKQLGVVADWGGNFYKSIKDTFDLSDSDINKIIPKFNVSERKVVLKDSIDSFKELGQYNPENNTIKIHPDAPAIVIIHELSHQFLETMMRLSDGDVKVNPKLQKAIDLRKSILSGTLGEEFANKLWSELSPKDKEYIHERFAFEYTLSHIGKLEKLLDDEVKKAKVIKDVKESLAETDEAVANVKSDYNKHVSSLGTKLVSLYKDLPVAQREMDKLIISSINQLYFKEKINFKQRYIDSVKKSKLMFSRSYMNAYKDNNLDKLKTQGFIDFVDGIAFREEVASRVTSEFDINNPSGFFSPKVKAALEKLDIYNDLRAILDSHNAQDIADISTITQATLFTKDSEKLLNQLELFANAGPEVRNLRSALATLNGDMEKIKEDIKALSDEVKAKGTNSEYKKKRAELYDKKKRKAKDIKNLEREIKKSSANSKVIKNTLDAIRTAANKRKELVTKYQGFIADDNALETYRDKQIVVDYERNMIIQEYLQTNKINLSSLVDSNFNEGMISKLQKLGVVDVENKSKDLSDFTKLFTPTELNTFLRNPTKDDLVQMFVNHEMSIKYADESAAIAAQRIIQNRKQKILREVFKSLRKVTNVMVEDETTGKRFNATNSFAKVSRAAISNVAYHDLNPSYFDRRSKRAFDDACSEFIRNNAKDSFELMIISKTYNEMGVVSSTIRNAVRKKITNITRALNGKDKNKVYDLNELQKAQYIASTIGIVRNTKLVNAKFNQAVQLSPDVLSVISDDGLVGLNYYENMSTGNLLNALEQIEKHITIAKEEKAFRIQERNALFDKLSRALSREFESNTSELGKQFNREQIRKETSKTNTLKGVERLKHILRSIKNSSLNLETLTNILDQKESHGKFWKAIYQPIYNAHLKFNDDCVKLNQKVKELQTSFKILNEDLSVKDIIIDMKDYGGNNIKFGEGTDGYGNLRIQLLPVITQMGNPSGREAVMRTLGLSEVDFEKFFIDMERKGIINKDMMDYAQKIWDIYDDLYKKVDNTLYEVEGKHLTSVGKIDIETSWGTYKGGYVPIYYKDRNFEIPKSIDELVNEFKETIPTNAGFLKDRLQNNRTLDLDFKHLFMGFEKQLRFANFAKAVSDIDRLLTGKLKDENGNPIAGSRNLTLSEYIDDATDGVGKKLIFDTLTDVFRGTTEDAARMTYGEKIIHNLGIAANSSLLVLNLSNAIQQFTGLIVAKTRMGVGSIGYGIRHRMKVKDISSRSAFMRERFLTNKDRLNITIRDTLTDSRLSKFQNMLNDHAYIFQRYTQEYVDSVVWTGKYNEVITKYKANLANSKVSFDRLEQLAIEKADAAVRSTQGTFNILDQPYSDKRATIVKSILPFTSYFSTIRNLIRTSYAIVDRRASNKLDKALSKVWINFLAIIAPTIASVALRNSVTGGYNDEDKESTSYGVEMFNSIASGMLSNINSIAGVVGGIGLNAVSDLLVDDYNNYTSSGYNFPLYQVLTDMFKSIKAAGDTVINDEDFDENGYNALINCSGIINRTLPNTLRYLYTWNALALDSDIDTSNDLDNLRAVLSGRLSKDQKE